MPRGPAARHGLAAGGRPRRRPPRLPVLRRLRAEEARAVRDGLRDRRGTVGVELDALGRQELGVGPDDGELQHRQRLELRHQLHLRRHRRRRSGRRAEAGGDDLDDGISDQQRPHDRRERRAPRAGVAHDSARADVQPLPGVPRRHQPGAVLDGAPPAHPPVRGDLHQRTPRARGHPGGVPRGRPSARDGWLLRRRAARDGAPVQGAGARARGDDEGRRVPAHGQGAEPRQLDRQGLRRGQEVGHRPLRRAEGLGDRRLHDRDVEGGARHQGPDGGPRRPAPHRHRRGELALRGGQDQGR